MKQWFRNQVANLTLLAAGTGAAGCHTEAPKPVPKNDAAAPADAESAAKPAAKPSANTGEASRRDEKTPADTNRDGKVSREEWLAAVKAGSLALLEQQQKDWAALADKDMAKIRSRGETPSPEQLANAAIMKNDANALKAALAQMNERQKTDYLDEGFVSYREDTPATRSLFSNVPYALPYAPLIAACSFYPDHAAIMQERNNVNDIMRVLLEAGANPNPQINVPLTILLQDTKKLGLLKEFGANLLAGRDPQESCLNVIPLTYSSSYDERELQFDPKQHYTNPWLLNDSAPASQSVEKMKYLLQLEDTDMAAIVKRRNPLIFSRDEVRTKLLIEHGAPVTSIDHFEGNMPLHYGRDLGSVKAMMEAGADPFAQNENGQTARDVIAELYDKEKSEPVRKQAGETDEHWASRREKHEAAIKELAGIIHYLEAEMAKAPAGVHTQKQNERREGGGMER